jgi:hypothetical protein
LELLVVNVLIDCDVLACWFYGLLEVEELLAIVPALVESLVDSTLWRLFFRSNREACCPAQTGEVIHNYGDRVDEKSMLFIGLYFYKTYTLSPLSTPEPAKNAIHSL